MHIFSLDESNRDYSQVCNLSLKSALFFSCIDNCICKTYFSFITFAVFIWLNCIIMQTLIEISTLINEEACYPKAWRGQAIVRPDKTKPTYCKGVTNK